MSNPEYDRVPLQGGGKGTVIEVTKDDLAINMQIAKKIESATVKNAKEVMSAAQQMEEAKEALDRACNTIKAEMITVIRDTLPKVLTELRASRMSLTSECSAALKPLEDLRKFFLGESHEKEMERLKEFLDVAERLKKLKDSGFLDTVADTILKLS